MKGRVALVTGGGKGIGAGIVRRLAASGVRVAATGRDQVSLDKIAKETGALPIIADVTDAAHMEAALVEVKKKLGTIGILVHNAGIASSAKFTEVSDETFERVMEVNVAAPFRITRSVIPDMLLSKYGRIIHIASNAGLTGYPYTSAYCTSKHAIVGLTRALAIEYAKSGITVNAVCPGFVDTEMTTRSIDTIVRKTGKNDLDARGALEAMSPQGRFMSVEEIAGFVHFLASDEGRGINGQALAIDGGQVLK